MGLDWRVFEQEVTSCQTAFVDGGRLPRVGMAGSEEGSERRMGAVSQAPRLSPPVAFCSPTSAGGSRALSYFGAAPCGEDNAAVVPVIW